MASGRMWGSGGFRPERGNSSVPTATARWAASTPVDRINAPLDGFRPEHGNLSALTAIRRLRRPWTVLSRAWGSFAPTAHNPMGGIYPCGPNKRPSKRFSSRTRKLVRAGRHSPSTEAVGRLRSWRPCPRRTPRLFRIRLFPTETHFFRNGKFTDRRGAPVSPVTRIQSPIKEKTQKNAFLQNHRIH